MRVHVAAIADHPLAGTVRELGVHHGRRHTLADVPEEADMILLCGSFSRDPAMLTENTLFRSFRSKCAVYSGDDSYCPIAPGVYTSARRGASTLLGRVRTHAYASSYGVHGNEAVAKASRGPRRPTGAPGSGGVLLFSFEGTGTSRVRRRLFALDLDPDEALVRDTSPSYKHFDHSSPGRLSGQRRYVETMMRSRFVLCPRGVGTGTLRLFEAMSLGVAPVLLSDRYVLPRGPRWEQFLVRVPERRVRRLAPTLRRLAASSPQRGELARRAWLEWFAPEVLFDRLVDAASEALRAAEPMEGVYRMTTPLLTGGDELRRRIHRTLGSRLHPVP